MRNDRLRLRLRHGSCRFLRHGSCRGSETWILHTSCVEDLQKWNIVRQETWIHKYADMALAQVLCSYPMRVSSLISPYIGSTSGSGSAVGGTFGEGGRNDRLPLRLWLWAWIYVKAREAQPRRTEAGGGTGEGAGRSTSTLASGWILEGMLTHGSCRGSETWILHKCTVEDSQTWILQRT